MADQSLKTLPATFDASESAPPWARWFYVAGGIAFIGMGIGNPSDLQILGIAHGTFNISLGVSYLLLGVFFQRLSRRRLTIEENAVVYATPLRKRRIVIDNIDRVELERMRVALKGPTPFDLDLSSFSYEQIQTLKPALYGFLRQQAERRSIPILDRA